MPIPKDTQAPDLSELFRKRVKELKAQISRVAHDKFLSNRDKIKRISFLTSTLELNEQLLGVNNGSKF